MTYQLHILFLIDVLEVGGIQTQLLAVVKHLGAAGYRCTVGCFRRAGNRMAAQFREAGARVDTLDKSDGFDLRFVVSLRRYLRRTSPDLIHAMTPRVGFWTSLAKPFGMQAPLIGSLLNSHEFESVLSRLLEAIITSRRVDAVFINSQSAADAYRAAIPAAPDLKVIPNGVSIPGQPTDRLATRLKLGLPSEATLICTVGRLVPIKRQRDAIEAMLHLRRAGVTANLVIVGDGPLRFPLLRFAKRHGLAGQVHFLGERENVVPILAACDLFVLPSRSEGLPNALLEAMAAGLPIVATRVGGIPEAVTDGVEAVLIPPANPRRLATALMGLIKEPQRALELAAAAANRARRDFSLERMTDRMERLYRARTGNLRVDVATIHSQFPKLSETFILREIVELRRRGIAIAPVSLKPAAVGQGHGEACDPAVEGYAGAPLAVRYLAALIAEMRRNPTALLAATLILLRLHWTSPRLALLALLVWPKAVYIARRLRTRGCRLVHAQWASLPAGVGAAMARLMGSRFSFTGHAYDLYHQGVALRAKISRAQFVATCTDGNRDYLRAKASPNDRDRIHLVRHWIANPPPFVPRAGASGDRAVMVLSVGSLVPYKGFDMLIRAVAIANQQRPVKLTIIGDGPQRGALQALAAKLHLDIQMPGALPQNAVFSRLGGADVFALASMPGRGPSDNLPNVLVESAFAGVPFVMTDIGSVGELVEDGLTGLLVPPGNPRAMAKAILRLAEDESLVRTVTTNARHRAESMFSVERNASRLERLMRSAIHPSTKGRSTSNAAA